MQFDKITTLLEKQTELMMIPQRKDQSLNTRTKEDGLLLVISGRVYGKDVAILVDSGATRCYIHHTTVERLGLHTIADESLLELVDGSRCISRGKCPQVPLCLQNQTFKLQCTVAPLFGTLDLILGINWLEMCNPLIDWKGHRLFLQIDGSGSWIQGVWASNEIQPASIKTITTEDVPPSSYSSLKILQNPTFWTYSGSQLPWRKASPSRGKAHTTEIEVKTVNNQSKAKGDDVLVSAKRMSRLIRDGKIAYLVMVRSNSGETEAVKRDKMKKVGPKKNFAKINEVQQQILDGVPKEHKHDLETILKEFCDVFPEKLPTGKPPKQAIEHEIQLEDGSKPPNRPPYRLGPKE